MERKSNPVWNPNKALLLGTSTEIVRKTSEPNMIGENKFGEWNLWEISVENQMVLVDRSPEQGYTGDAVMFLSSFPNKMFTEIGKGANVRVKVTKTTKGVDYELVE